LATPRDIRKETMNMKNWLIGALAVAVLATAAVPTVSEAKRLGSGKSAGMNRDMPARTAPDAPAGKPAQTQPSAAPTSPAAAPAAAGAAAAAPKRNWMGPLAGLAAGLGIAALMSHLGMGEAFGNFLMMALLAMVAVFVIGFLIKRFGNKRTPALAGAAASGNSTGTAVAWPQNTERTSLEAPAAGGRAEPSLNPAALAPVEAAAEVQPAARTVAKAFVPAAFDSETFTRTAKMIFIRLQAANDTADLDDLKRFTTPELFASLRLDIQDRGNQPQHTDVQKVDAQVLDVAQEASDQVVSVRFTGLVVEEKGAAAVPFNEVWHLVKPLDDSRSWAIAGIEQTS
jgi:predicted lipid-binding transport protein (Tim44 family)